MKLIRAYLQLTKTGIILFSIVSALAGYAVSFQLHQSFDGLHPTLLVIGLYLVAAGGFAINQAQEWKIDSRMERTRRRPIPAGLMRPWQAYFSGFLLAV